MTGERAAREVEVVERLVLHDADFVAAVHRIRRAVDPETLDEAVSDALLTAYLALRSSVLEELKQELLSKEAQRLAGEAACRDREGEDAPWVPGSVHAMSWEGNAAAGIEAALGSLASEGGEQKTVAYCHDCGKTDDPRRTTCLGCGGQLQELPRSEGGERT